MPKDSSSAEKNSMTCRQTFTGLTKTTLFSAFAAWLQSCFDSPTRKDSIHMELYLDSSDPKEIVEACSWGLISGVTTNPMLISAAGPDMEKTVCEIVKASPGSVLVQTIGWHDPKPLIRQARWLHDFSDKIVVKLPISIAGIQALLELKRQVPDICLAITAVASIAQAYLCGKAGADIVAVFNGPLDQTTDSMIELVAPIKKIYANYGFRTKVLSCGRYPRLFGEVAAAGTDICTMKIEFLRLLYEHPFTDKRMNGFLKDWRTVFGDKTWPEK
jgi:transaldolase